MIKKFFIASAATITAATMISGTASAATPTPQRSSAKQQAQAGEKKYCLAYDNVVGSRVTRSECRTKAQWARDGVNVDEMIKG